MIDTPSISYNNCWIDNDSWIPADIAMYSASAVDSATVGCFFVVQLTGQLLILITYPVVDFLSVKSPPQSASVHASIDIGNCSCVSSGFPPPE